MINWTLINIIGYIVIILLSIIGACIVALCALIVATMISDKRRAKRDSARRREPITQARVTTVPRRQEIPQAFYDAFK